MELFCPECMSALSVESSSTASCKTCGEKFKVLFSPQTSGRSATSAIPQPQSSSIVSTAPIPPANPADNIATKCPKCSRTFMVSTSSVGKNAKCSCGEVFTIAPIPTPAAAARTRIMCVNHSSVPATDTCVRCGKGICQLCSFRQPNGDAMCPDCMASNPGTIRDQTVEALSSMSGEIPVPVVQKSSCLSTKCRWHPQADAMHICQSCRAPICSTCDFSFPGGIHLCPTCATSKPKGGLTGKRKTLLIFTFAMATWGTLMYILTFTGAFAEVDPIIAEKVFGLLLVIPILIGSGLSIACFERRLGNPPVVWVAFIWNMILLAIFLILFIIGVMT